MTHFPTSILWRSIAGALLIASAPFCAFSQWSDPAKLDAYPPELAGTFDIAPQIATDHAGNWITTWYSIEGLASSWSNDYGMNWSQQSQVHAITETGPFWIHDLTYAGNGTWVTIWRPEAQDNYHALVALSRDKGQNWGQPVELTGNDTEYDYDGMPQELQSDSNGTVIAIVDSVLYRSTDSGETWSSNYTTPATGLAHSHELSYAGNGKWLLVYQSHVINEPNSQRLHVVLSSDNGATWSEPQTFNPEIATEAYAVTADEDDMGILSFFTGGFRMLVSSDGGATWTPSDALSITTVRQSRFSLSRLPDEKWLLVHDNVVSQEGLLVNRDLFAYKADSLAGPWSDAQGIATSTALDETHPALGVDIQGNVVVAYESAPPYKEATSHRSDIHAVHSTNAAQTWNGPSPISMDGQLNDPYDDGNVTIVAGDNGTMIAAWVSSTRTNPTNIVFARSEDSGKTWSAATHLAQGDSPILEYAGQGRWLLRYDSPQSISLYQHLMSDNDGLTWSAPASFEKDLHTTGTSTGSTLGTIISEIRKFDPPPIPVPLGYYGYRYGLARLSRDSQTWEAPHYLDLARGDMIRHIVHSGGTYWFAVTENEALYTSFDDGLSWAQASSVKLPLSSSTFVSDHAGTVIAVYHRTENGTVKYFTSSSTNNGLSWTEPVLIPELPQPPSTAQLTATGNGQWVLAMRIDSLETSPQMYIATSSDAGKTWTAPELVLNFGDGSFGPALAANADHIILAWSFLLATINPVSLLGPYQDLLYTFKPVPDIETPDPAADLTGDWDLTETECKNTKKGQKCKLKAQVVMANVGEVQAAEKSVVRFYLSDNPVVDSSDIELKSKKLPKLKPGKSKNQKVNLKTDQPFTGKYLIAVLDADGQVTETNESNNTIVSQPLQ